MTKHNFLFDLVASQPNADGAFHGGGKYAKKLFIELVNKGSAEWKLLAFFDSTKKLDHEIKSRALSGSVELIDIKGKTLSEIVLNNNIQRFYSALPFMLKPYKFEILQKINNCEIVVTIHGLRNLELSTPVSSLTYKSSAKETVKKLLQITFKKYYYYNNKRKFRDLILNTSVIAVSNHTRYAIKSFFPDFDDSKIKVFYSPDVTEFDSSDEENEEFSHSNYFLLVSGNRWLKNNLRSAMAIDKLFTDNKDFTQNVVITGVSNKSIYLNKLVNKHRFIFYKYVSDSFLRKLNKNAFALIYMSLNEGFGYPPLEAMKHGVPILTNSFTSIFEICDNAVLYSNPYSIREIATRLLYLYDNKVYKDLCNNSLERYKIINERQVQDLDSTIEYLLAYST